MASPETSIIIRTFNEERHLPGLLEALSHQSYRDFETVLVDSGSLDRTREIAAPLVDKLLRIDSHDFTFGYSLNVGIQASSGEIAVIVSAHTLPTNEKWLVALLEPLRDKSTAMSFGRQLGWTSSYFSESQDLNRTFGTRRRVLHPPNFFGHNGNSAIRKDLWQQHPFDENLPGLEDIEWVKYWMERGCKVVYDPAAALYHIHEEGWRQVRRRYYGEAVAARWIGIKGRRDVPREAGREVAYTLLDCARSLWPFGDRVIAREGGLGRGPEIFLFRANKALGTMQGLLDGGMMQDPVAREAMYFDRTSKAVVIQAPGRASLEEVMIPEVKPGDVLIRTAYNGICGTDLAVFGGTLGNHQSNMAKYPIVPGHEMSGQIVATGPNVSHLQEGDPVVVESNQSCGACSECRRSNWMACSELVELGVMGRDGGYSEYVVVPGRYVHLVPPGLDLRKAALCQPLAMILKGLNRLSRYWPSEPQAKRCAVVGAGSLGHFCARVLDLRGHKVTAFDREPLRRSYFNGSGIESSDDMSRLAEFDVLVEITGDPEALDTMVHQSAPGSTILLLSLPYAQREFSFQSIAAYDKTVVGSVGCGSEDFEEALRLLPELDLDPYLQRILPVNEFREAWEDLRQQKHLKVLLAVSQELS